MFEYIEREALLKSDDWQSLKSDFDKARAHIIILGQPAADVVEVKHGEWLPDYETFVDDSERESEPIQTGWVCSLCGRQEFQKEPYCHCGAKMDGDKNELS